MKSEREPQNDTEKYRGTYAKLSIESATAIESGFIDGNIKEATTLTIDDHSTLPAPLTSFLVKIHPPQNITGEDLKTPSFIQTEISFPPVSQDTQHTVSDAIIHLLSEKSNGKEIEMKPTGLYDTLTLYQLTIDESTTIDIIISIDNITLKASSVPPIMDNATINSKATLHYFYETSIAAIDALVKEFDQENDPSEQLATIRLDLPQTFAIPLVSRELVPINASENHENSTQVPAPNAFDTLGGLTDAKKRLHEMAKVFKHPDLAAELDIDPTHFILYGPPGTGKTSLVRAFADEIGAELRAIKSSEIVNSYLGKSATNFSEIIQKAIADSKEKIIVIFFDEFDSIADKQAVLHREYGQIINTIKEELDDVTHPEKGSKSIVIAAATNKDKDDMNDAIMRRFEPIAAPIPNEMERADIWQTLIDQREQRRIDTLGGYDSFPGPDASVFHLDYDISQLVQDTDEMTGADFNKIVKAAQMKKFVMSVDLRESGRQDELDKNPQLKQITQADLNAAIREYRSR